MSQILRQAHINILENLPQFVRDEFVFSGGTALAEYYIKHRLSDDIDFFCVKKNTDLPIDHFLSALSNIGKTQFERTNGRILFTTNSINEVIKIDFCPLHFDRINEPRLGVHGYLVDSLHDLAANKLLAMCGRNEPKDFIDIYFLHNRFNLDIEKLIGLAEIKSKQPYQYLLNLDRVERIAFDKELFKIITDFHDDDLKHYFYSQNKIIKNKISSFIDDEFESQRM